MGVGHGRGGPEEEGLEGEGHAHVEGKEASCCGEGVAQSLL